MKFKLGLLLFLFFTACISYNLNERKLASVDSVDCSLSYYFCLEEFLDVARNSKTISNLISKLPRHVKRNLTFKRGNNIQKRIVGHLGPHGHKVSKKPSSSSSPEQPRVFVWDEKTGFTASWNSGNSEHRAFDRVDLYGFDFEKKEHLLAAWFPADKEKIFGKKFDSGKAQDCTGCHGQVERPIFPMYPDWPQFYGEFNDEMTGYAAGKNALRSDLKLMANEFQPVERRMYRKFLENEGRRNPRYSTVLNAQPSNDSNPYYPYRPNTATSPSDTISRAFAKRPNLRLGVLYNRLAALQTFEKIKKSILFQKFPDIIFYSMLDCNWDYVEGNGQGGRAEILGKLLEEAKKYSQFEDLNLRGARFSSEDIRSNERGFYQSVAENGEKVFYRNKKYTDKFYRQIPYEDLLKILELNIADMDIRYKHNSSLKVNKGYGVYNPKAYYHTDNAMDIGYVKQRYKMNPVCNNSGKSCRFTYNGTYMEGMEYFNSYFDGSATTNELLAAQMLIYLTDSRRGFSDQNDLRDVSSQLQKSVPSPEIYFETLNKKYARFKKREPYDKTFFARMDALSPWIQLPYPPDMLNIQNRESFWGGGRTREIRYRHAQWKTLADRKSRTFEGQNRLNGKNICWNVYNIMAERYRKK